MPGPDDRIDSLRAEGRFGQPPVDPLVCRPSQFEKSNEDRPCKAAVVGTSVIFGERRHHRARIAEEHRLRSPVASSVLLWLIRGASTSIVPEDVRTCRRS